MLQESSDGGLFGTKVQGGVNAFVIKNLGVCTVTTRRCRCHRFHVIIRTWLHLTGMPSGIVAPGACADTGDAFHVAKAMSFLDETGLTTFDSLPASVSPSKPKSVCGIVVS